MDLGYSGATAAVTGGTKGMGRAIVEILADEGANVVVLARGQAALDETVASLESKGIEAIGLSVDVLEPEQITAAFAAIDAKWGSLNILVNTIGPSGRQVPKPDRRGLGDGVRARHDGRGALRRAALPCCVGPSGRESATSRRTRSSARASCCRRTRRPRRRSRACQEPRQIPRTRRHPRETAAQGPS